MTIKKTITRSFTSDELEDGELIYEAETVDMSRWRHGHCEARVFEFGGEHWLTWVNFHHDEGLDFYYPVTAVKVEQVEVVVKKWVEVEA